MAISPPLFESALGKPDILLNALYIPGGIREIPAPENLASGDYAFLLFTHETMDKHDYPRAAMRWQIMSTENAWSPIHVDGGGHATFSECISGEKIWLFLKPKDPSTVFNADFYNEHYLEQLDNFDVSAILVKPGTAV